MADRRAAKTRHNPEADPEDHVVTEAESHGIQVGGAHAPEGAVFSTCRETGFVQLDRRNEGEDRAKNQPPHRRDDEKHRSGAD